MKPAAFGLRPHSEMSGPPPSQQQPPNLRRPPGSSNSMTPPSTASLDNTPVTLSFNVPFASNLGGPDVEYVLHSSKGALQRWTFPEGTDESTPNHKLPVHANNVEALRELCRHIGDTTGGRMAATVTSTERKAASALQRTHPGLVTNVCITGEGESVHKMRAKILNETPISLVCLSSLPMTYRCRMAVMLMLTY